MRSVLNPQNPILVEACVTSLAEAQASQEFGADRLELCVDLSVGGLTPSDALVREVCEGVELPVMAMIRPHARTFCADSATVKIMLTQIEALSTSGVAGFVFGVLDERGHIDQELLKELVSAAGKLPVTFHRAFDDTPDLLLALDCLKEAGVSRVLTGGGPDSAWIGRKKLNELVQAGEGRIVILGGGSVRGDHVVELTSATGLTEVHARAVGIGDIVKSLRS